MSTTFRILTLVLLCVALLGCSAGVGGVSPPTSPADPEGESGSPATPDFGSIDHPTGPTDLVLRFEEGGGFVMIDFLATQAPAFSLYGDGTIVFRNPADAVEPVGGVSRMPPFKTSRLTEAQVQDLLTFALGESGLGVARPEYRNDLVADASTAVFTVNAGGLKKSVSVYALGLEMEGSADAAARAALARLAERLRTIDAGGTLDVEPFVPARYRGILLEGQPGVPNAKPWPWIDIVPTDFVSNGDPNAFQLPARVMSPAEVETLGIEGHAGGFQSLALNGPNDGKVYSFSLRPLLPDEEA